MNIKEEIAKNKEIRNKILKALYIQAEKGTSHFASCLGRVDLEAETGIDEYKLYQELLFLEDEGYLEVMDHSAVYFDRACITPSGRSYVENLQLF